MMTAELQKGNGLRLVLANTHPIRLVPDEPRRGGCLQSPEDIILPGQVVGRTCGPSSEPLTPQQEATTRVFGILALSALVVYGVVNTFHIF